MAAITSSSHQQEEDEIFDRREYKRPASQRDDDQFIREYTQIRWRLRAPEKQTLSCVADVSRIEAE